VNQPGEYLEPAGLRVTVDRVIYTPELPMPSGRQYRFIYYISIHNDSDLPVRIEGRKWVVTNSRGAILAIEGEGVVGQFPTIEPGGKFTYNSSHLLDTRSGVAEGSYRGVDASGRKVLTRIPRFELVVPE
jgi:ApaG protein